MDRIKTVRATGVSIPLNMSIGASYGTTSRITRTIVEIESDRGISGLGETGCGVEATLINDIFAPAIVGMDISARSSVRARCLPQNHDYESPLLDVATQAYAGIEIALWDLLGKTLDVSVVDLLGGPCRPGGRFSAYSYAPITDEASVPGALGDIAAERIRETGADTFEFKIGCHSIDCDIETLQVLNDVLPRHVGIAVDANLGLSERDARRFLSEAGKTRLSNIEEPVFLLADMARLRREFGVPVSTHARLDRILPYTEIDATVGSIDVLGGIETTRSAATLARAHGRQFWFRSYPETGIMWSVMVCLAAAVPALDRPSQCLTDLIAETLVQEAVPKVIDGIARPISKPGLGIALDCDAFSRCSRDFDRLGPVYDYLPFSNLSAASELSSRGLQAQA